MRGSPTVVDRGIQQAIAPGLGPIFDSEFSRSSFGFRPGRSAHQALKQIQSYSQRGAKVAVDMDLAQFFDRVNHDALRARGVRKVRHKTLLRWGGKYLRAGGVVGESRQPTAAGGPQGAPLSPLVSNLRLDDREKGLERRGHRFARYCDAFLRVVHSRRAGARVKARLTRFPQQHLPLEINESKSTVGPPKEGRFLGFTFHGTRLAWASEAFQDFRHHVPKLTGRSWGVSRTYRIRKLNEYIRGGLHY